MIPAMASGSAETPGAVAPAPPDVATAASINATMGGKVKVLAMILAAACAFVSWTPLLFSAAFLASLEQSAALLAASSLFAMSMDSTNSPSSNRPDLNLPLRRKRSPMPLNVPRFHSPA